MSNSIQSVSALDRLSFTVFIALALHALVIFGINFEFTRGQSSSPTLDVTLSLHDTESEQNEDADFLADKSHQGSGTLDEAALLKSTEQAEIEDNQIFHTTPTIEQISFSRLSTINERIIAVESEATFETQTSNPAELETPSPLDGDSALVVNNITDVATLKALLDESRQSYANRPRIRTLTAMSTRRAVDANYIFDWLQTIERIGNQNYPQAARDQRITGDVRLAVSINADGSLRSVEVTGSSGSSILDQAAKQIVYLAAPFPEFSVDMLEEYDVLEIIRTWQFRIDNQFGVLSNG